MRIFLAGATGAVGRPLTRLLVAAGHAVTGTTRSPHKAPTIEAAGATAAVVDAYDGDAVRAAVVAARPDVVIHQLTDLPGTRDPATYPAALAANARLRVVATPNLVVAARAAGARRFIAQSVAFAYPPGTMPWRETDPLDFAGEGTRAVLVRGAGGAGDRHAGHRGHRVALRLPVRPGHLVRGAGRARLRPRGRGRPRRAHRRHARRARHLQHRRGRRRGRDRQGARGTRVRPAIPDQTRTANSIVTQSCL